MSLYQKLSIWGPKLFSKAWVFRNGFNWSPMYRRSTGKIVFVSEDLRDIRVEIQNIHETLSHQNEMELPKTTLLTNATGEVIFCEVSKVLYIAKKEYYKAKKAKRNNLNKE